MCFEIDAPQILELLEPSNELSEERGLTGRFEGREEFVRETDREVSKGRKIKES